MNHDDHYHQRRPNDRTHYSESMGPSRSTRDSHRSNKNEEYHTSSRSPEHRNRKSSNIDDKLNWLDSENQHLSDLVKDLKSDIKYEKQERSTVQKENDKLLAENKELKDQISALKSTLKTCKISLAKCKNDFAVDLDERQKTLEQVQAQCSTLEKDNKKLHLKLARQHEMLDEANQIKDNLAAQLHVIKLNRITAGVNVLRLPPNMNNSICIFGDSTHDDPHSTKECERFSPKNVPYQRWNAYLKERNLTVWKMNRRKRLLKFYHGVKNYQIAARDDEDM